VFVCFCNGVTEADIAAVVRAGAGTDAEVVERSGASARCGGCRGTLARLLIVHGIATDDRPWGDDGGCPSVASCPMLHGHDRPPDCPSAAQS